MLAQSRRLDDIRDVAPPLEQVKARIAEQIQKEKLQAFVRANPKPLSQTLVLELTLRNLLIEPRFIVHCNFIKLALSLRKGR